MSDPIKHECGLAFIRLRKPFSYYQKKYGTVMWGLNKLYLLMEKQHNRGQDGAGVTAVKLDVEPGYPFLHRIRSVASNGIRRRRLTADKLGPVQPQHRLAEASEYDLRDTGHRGQHINDRLHRDVHGLFRREAVDTATEAGCSERR